jgi:hypothetical protein
VINGLRKHATQRNGDSEGFEPPGIVYALLIRDERGRENVSGWFREKEKADTVGRLSGKVYRVVGQLI